MSAADRLVKTMQKAARKSDPLNLYTDVVFGVVISVDPLIVRVGDKLEVTEDFLILSPFCKKTLVELENKKIQLWDNLKVDDSLTMLKVQRGQAFIVLYRDSIVPKEVGE